MLHRSWETGEESFYLEKNVNIVGAEKWPSLQQFNCEEPHAIFEYDDDQRCFWVRDLSADSGMRVNGIPLSKTHSAKLKNGDKICFGYSPDYTFTFSPVHQPRVGGRQNGYQNEYGVQPLPKLHRGRAQSPRTLPSTVVLVEPEIPYPKRSPSPKTLTNAYRRRVFRAGSFDIPTFGHHTKPKVIANAWGNDKVHYGSISSPSHSGSWDGMIEKQSPRSRGAFANTQQSQMLREMQNKISHLESLLQHEQETKHSHQHNVVDDATKTVELAQQILELRTQLNKKDEEIRNLKEKSENDHESLTAKNELIRLKAQLAKSEKLRTRLESELDDKVHTLVSTYDSHGHLKFHDKKFHDHHNDHGLLDSARSADSLSTVHHHYNDSNGLTLNDSSASTELFHSNKFDHDNLEGKVVDQKIQLKVYETKIAELEKKLKHTMDVKDIDLTERHHYKNTMDAIDYNKNLSVLEEEKQILLKGKERSELIAEAAVILFQEILQFLLDKINSTSDNKDSEIKNIPDFMNKYKDELKNFVKNSHHELSDEEFYDIFRQNSVKFEHLLELARKVSHDCDQLVNNTESIDKDNKHLEMKITVLNKLLKIVKDDMEKKLEQIEINPGLLAQENFTSLPDKVDEYTSALVNSMNDWGNEDKPEMINWVHEQLSDLYVAASKIFPILVSSLNVAEIDKNGHEAFENFQRKLNEKCANSENIDVHDVIADTLTSSNFSGHWLQKEIQQLVDMLSQQSKQRKLLGKVDQSHNTGEDLSNESFDELQQKIRDSENKEQSYINKVEGLEAELNDAKEKLQQTQDNFKAVLGQREEYSKLALDQAQKYIANLESQIKNFENDKQNSAKDDSKTNNETESLLDKLKSENESLNKVIESLKETVSKEEQEKLILKNQIDDLEAQLEFNSRSETINGTHSSVDDEMAELKQKLQSLENGSNEPFLSLEQKQKNGIEARNKVYDGKFSAALDQTAGTTTHRNGFFDGPFQDVADHFNSSHSSLINSFKRNNEHRTDDSEDKDMFWNLSQRLASMLDLDLKKRDAIGHMSDVQETEVRMNDQKNAAQEIAGRVEELLQRIRQQNEELNTAREPRNESAIKKEEKFSLSNGTTEEASSKQHIRVTSAKPDKRKKQEMPMKVVTFKLPEK